METATIFQLARLRGVRAACILGVSDLVSDARTRMVQEDLEELGIKLGEAGYQIAGASEAGA
jgi:uridine phosphorylase